MPEAVPVIVCDNGTGVRNFEVNLSKLDEIYM